MLFGTCFVVCYARISRICHCCYIDVSQIVVMPPDDVTKETVGALDINLDSTGHEFKVERGRHSATWRSISCRGLWSVGACLANLGHSILKKTERRSSWLDCPFYLRIGSRIFVIFALAGACGQVYIKDADIPTSFAESRDWFELFFDDIFAPPKLFNIVIQWLAPGLMICDHVHTLVLICFRLCIYGNNREWSN